LHVRLLDKFKFALFVDVVFTRNTEACGLLVMTGTLVGKKGNSRNDPVFLNYERIWS